MSLPTQGGFWQDKVIANTREKLTDLYHTSPDIVNSDKICLLTYWSEYDSLSDLLGDKWLPFVEWFLDATSATTIARCMRSLKEDGTISLSEKQVEHRQAQENNHRRYWGNGKRLGNNHESVSDSDRGA